MKQLALTLDEIKAKYPVPSRQRKGQRTGYTTGTNAAAAATAATTALLTGEWPETVQVSLPLGETARMQPVERHLSDDTAYCCMVKDAGDDPDVTHGALICAEVRRTPSPGITLKGGEGVGTVTLPGLGLEVNGPAINPVPRQQIRENVERAATAIQANFLDEQGLEVVISVPHGAVIAKKTLNARLGILEGISILGTTGKVFAYSTAAWRASVIQAVEMAAHNSLDKVVLATGGRSERFAMGLFPELPDVSFVELSVFTGAALKTCLDYGVKSAVFVGMMGKMVKTAQGHMTTHVAGNQVNFDFLSQLCQTVQAPAGLVEAVAHANTGRHFLELCQAWQIMAPVQRVVELALTSCQSFIQSHQGSLELEVILIDFDGTVLGRAKSGTPPDPVSPGLTLIERLRADPAASYDDEGIMGQSESGP